MSNFYLISGMSEGTMLRKPLLLGILFSCQYLSCIGLPATSNDSTPVPPEPLRADDDLEVIDTGLNGGQGGGGGDGGGSQTSNSTVDEEPEAYWMWRRQWIEENDIALCPRPRPCAVSFSFLINTTHFLYMV